MEKRAGSFKLHLLELLSIIFLFSFFVQAQSDKSQDTTKTDTSNTSHMKKDTLGYNNINTPGSNSYSLNNNGSNVNREYSSINDTTKSDTSWKKPDSLGYNNIKSPEDSYASTEITGSDYFFQYDNSTKDTSETDTTKSDTLGYNSTNGSYYAYNNHEINSTIGLNMRSNFLVNPVKDLTQNLKLNVYLMDGQTVKVQKILREYEAKTYQSSGNNEEINKAANKALNDIADILTDRQKTEWKNTKDQWWASVNKAINLSSISKSKNNLE
jgi:hypothetical protein